MEVSCQSPSLGDTWGLPTGNWPRRPQLRWPKRRREGERPMADPIVVSSPISGTDTSLTFETGKLAFQSQGAVVATLGKTEVLVTANAAHGVREGIDFFPLTVDVEERMYAAGRIPGSFFRREGRPTDLAILTCRLIDRPLRPSFTDGYRNETQVVVTVMGVDWPEPLRRRWPSTAPRRPSWCRASPSRDRSAPCASPGRRRAVGCHTPPMSRARTPRSTSWLRGASSTTATSPS